MGGDEEIREFLLGWLLEFGTAPQTHEQRFASEWYEPLVESVDADIYHPYFHRTGDAMMYVFQLNQAGLDFIEQPNTL